MRGDGRIPVLGDVDPRASSALAWAAAAHGNQKYGDRPYVFHLAAVMNTAAELGFNSPAHLICAALHDVIEDTTVTKKELEVRFGAEIAAAVQQLSRPQGALLDSYFQQMGPLAFAVKIADRISNLRMHGREHNNRERQRTHLFPKYDREQAYFRKHPLAKDPRFSYALAVLELELAAARARLYGDHSSRMTTVPRSPAATVSDPSARPWMA